MNKTMLLIGIDGIGDYVLFRNFIRTIKEDSNYAEYKITFVGNKAWQDLSLGLDQAYFDNTIFIDRKKLTRNIYYRYRTLSKLNSIKYEIVLSPAYSRDFFSADWIVYTVAADQKIGSKSDLTNSSAWQINCSDKFYTKLIETTPGIEFEFYRNKKFFQNLLSKPIDIDRPKMVAVTNVVQKLSHHFVVLFIGASSAHRKWSILNYVNVARFLRSEFNFEIVLCGGPTDVEDAQIFYNEFGSNYVNLVNKVSLIELVEVIAKAKFMITNETGAAHFAAALSTVDFLIVSNGNHFCRFTPYPQDLSDRYHVIYPPLIEQNIDNFDQLVSLYGEGSDLNINDIEVGLVKKRIVEILKTKRYEVRNWS